MCLKHSWVIWYVMFVPHTAYVLINNVVCHTSIARLGFFNSQFVIYNKIQVGIKPYLTQLKLIADKRTVDSLFWTAYLTSIIRHQNLWGYTQPSLFLQKSKRIWGSLLRFICPPPYLESRYGKNLKFTPRRDSAVVTLLAFTSVCNENV